MKLPSLTGNLGLKLLALILATLLYLTLKNETVQKSIENGNHDRTIFQNR